MAYNDETANRIRLFFLENKVDFAEKPMFGGLCFMVDDKMCCGLRVDKATQQDLLMCRIDKELYEKALDENYVTPMEFTGRTMKGFVYILQDGFRTSAQLAHWLKLCLDYNPHANKSKK